MDTATSSAPENRIAKVPQKRPRPVLSCSECRRKKLKCSRTLPCAQCTKTGGAARCSYNEYAQSASPSEAAQDVLYSEDGGTVRKIASRRVTGCHEDIESPTYRPNKTQTSVAKLGIIEDLQSRLEKLEQELKSHIPNLNHLHEHERDDDYRTKRNDISFRGVVRLKGSTTRFHGQNQKVALLNHFEEARAFMKKLEIGSDDQSVFQIRNDLAVLQQSWSLQPKARHKEDFQDGNTILQRMLELLPPRSACDKLVTIYLDNFENELRVLHKPSFLSVFHRFWEAQTMNSMQFSDFIPQMLSVLAIASSLDDSCLIEDESSRGHGLASTYCDLVGSWLESLRGKQRLKVSTLQTQTLLLIATQTSVERVKDMWNATGYLVRSAMTIGLHRDPTESPQLPIFCAEMRRRLWVTIVEMDLQISMTCGMPTMVCATDFTCQIPANINDTDINLATNHPPSPKPFTEWSDCLPQVILAKSLRQRLNAARLLSNIQESLDYDEIVQHAQKLERVLQDLPPPLKFDHSSDENSQRPGRLMTRVLLDVHIRRAILNLYGPFAQADLGHKSFAEARKGFIRSSLVILCYQDIFDPDFADLDIIASPRYWDLFHVYCKNDMMHASLGVCLEIKRWSSKSRTLENGSSATSGRLSPYSPITNEPPDPVFTTWTKPSLTKAVEDNIDPLMRRLGRFGSDPKDLLCLSIVLNSIRAKQSPEQKEILMGNGIRELIGAYQQHLHKTRRSGVRDNGLELAENQLAPLPQTDNQNAAVLPGFNFGFLADSDLDFDEIDFGFAQDSQLDQMWG